MPIYEYLCKDCGVVEAIQKVNAEPLLKCPNCGAEKPKKIISRSSFQLKGGGWYNDGYASTSNKTAPGSSGKAETKTENPAKCSSGCKCH